MKVTDTPRVSASFCAPSFSVTQCWSMESMVIRAIMVPEPAAGVSVFAASVAADAAVEAATSSVLLLHPVIREAARPREQANANIFFIEFSSFLLSHTFLNAYISAAGTAAVIGCKPAIQIKPRASNSISFP